MNIKNFTTSEGAQLTEVQLPTGPAIVLPTSVYETLANTAQDDTHLAKLIHDYTAAHPTVDPRTIEEQQAMETAQNASTGEAHQQ